MNILKFMEQNKYLEDFISRSTYHSNAIEGSTLTQVETRALLYNDNSFKINRSPCEINEAINHKKVIEYVISYLQAGNYNISNIQKN